MAKGTNSSDDIPQGKKRGRLNKGLRTKKVTVARRKRRSK